MLEAQLYTAAADRKGSYALPDEFDGTVNRTVLYHAVRAYQNNQRQGTHSTKTRAEVSGGSAKPWRQKGTGRARQGTIRAAQWAGGGVVFGPKPRRYRTDLPRKARQLARQSAFNQRVHDGALFVIETLAFDQPKTRQMAELLAKLDLADRKVLVLTAEHRPEVFKSGRNLSSVHVMRYADASAYEVLWSDAVLVEESAIGGHAIKRTARSASAGRARRAKKAAEGTTKKRTTKKRATAKKKTTSKKKTAKRTATKRTKKKGGSDA
ncbi:MAG: 50S ribosomal protein L4 [Gemmatimonadales bacterium]|jgi:large subunit ribosomal protein L4